MTTTVLVVLPALIPVTGAVGYAVFGWRRATRWLGPAAAAALLATSIVLAAHVTREGSSATLGGLVRVDSLSAYMLIVIGAVAMLATLATPSYLDTEIRAKRATARTAARHNLLVQAFLTAMVAVVLAANLGALWVGVEATTIVTAFLVGHRRTRAAVEAAWKYVVIGSVGIAVAFLGVVLLNYASLHAGDAGLDWRALGDTAANLDPGVTRIAVALLIIGFGTKVGLVPLHAWLPDAHGQAPAPVSALMSGVLLAVAFYAILRVKVIADAALGVEFTRTLLAVLALATLVVAASLLLAQRDYKRMLAYSSMEHMGLIALGTAAGTQVAVTAVLLHILGHGLVKAVVFLGAGRVQQTTGSSLIEDVRGLVARQPLLAGCFGLGVLALVAMPPFSLFASGLGVVRAGYATGLGWATTAALVLVLVIGAALLTHTARMLLGAPREGPGTPGLVSPLPATTAVALVAGLGACAVIGIAPGPLAGLLEAAAALVGAS